MMPHSRPRYLLSGTRVVAKDTGHASGRGCRSGCRGPPPPARTTAALPERPPPAPAAPPGSAGSAAGTRSTARRRGRRSGSPRPGRRLGAADRSSRSGSPTGCDRLARRIAASDSCRQVVPIQAPSRAGSRSESRCSRTRSQVCWKTSAASAWLSRWTSADGPHPAAESVHDAVPGRLVAIDRPADQVRQVVGRLIGVHRPPGPPAHRRAWIRQFHPIPSPRRTSADRSWDPFHVAGPSGHRSATVSQSAERGRYPYRYRPRTTVAT